MKFLSKKAKKPLVINKNMKAIFHITWNKVFSVHKKTNLHEDRKKIKKLAKNHSR